MIRDPNTNALVSDDIGALTKYKEEKRRLKLMLRVESEFVAMRSEIDQLKQLVESLTSKIDRLEQNGAHTSTN